MKIMSLIRERERESLVSLMTSFMKIMSLMNELRIECVRKRDYVFLAYATSTSSFLRIIMMTWRRKKEREYFGLQGGKVRFSFNIFQKISIYYDNSFLLGPSAQLDPSLLQPKAALSSSPHSLMSCTFMLPHLPQ